MKRCLLLLGALGLWPVTASAQVSPPTPEPPPPANGELPDGAAQLESSAENEWRITKGPQGNNARIPQEWWGNSALVVAITSIADEGETLSPQEVIASMTGLINAQQDALFLQQMQTELSAIVETKGNRTQRLEALRFRGSTKFKDVAAELLPIVNARLASL